MFIVISKKKPVKVARMGRRFVHSRCLDCEGMMKFCYHMLVTVLSTVYLLKQLEMIQMSRT